MIASARAQTPSRPARVRVSERVARGIAAAHRLLEDVILPPRGSHAALNFPEIDRI